jgi:hypothetical protein
LLKKATTVTPKQSGKYDTNKFSQMYDLLATPNMFRNAAGAPGPAYYQQQADYKIDIELDDKMLNLVLKQLRTITILQFRLFMGSIRSKSTG